MADLSTDVLIVGAGLAGAATAYHLRRFNELRVTVVEQESTAGAHSSGRSAAFVRQKMDDPDCQRLADEGVAMMRSGQLAHYKACGLMLLGEGDEPVEPLFPLAQGSGLWYPQDGVVEVATLLDSYLYQQEVYYNTRVLAWEHQSDHLYVRTSQGGVMCRLLVNAAGPWAGTLGKLPLTPMNRHLHITPSMPNIDPDWPFVWDIRRGLYFRPESGGLLLSACDETPAEPGNYDEDPEMLSVLAHKLNEFQPILKEISIQRTWVGQRVFSPDQRFVIGFDPRWHGVFHVAGLGGHGVTTSYAVGKRAAEMILGHHTGPNPFDPARFVSAEDLSSPQ